ncbi:hypothetical protein JHK82_023260 [Glycine max]|nr:hypothetical protein JHK85_023794 [Glycine max]KAG5138529.1 hypothetical protein JHK82_023260 [Glycine max]
MEIGREDEIVGMSMIGFVIQEDVLYPQLTVEETLVFSALLRLPTHMSKQQKYAKVDTTIKELDLERCRHTKIVGGYLKGISGGERKRTCIGYEILVDHSLLLLDEPTSGLDSTAANKLLLTLLGLAEARRTIITTIHQPSSRIFHIFDKLLISEGYPVCYGKAKDTMEYFSSLRFTPQIPMNPAEFLLDLATGQVNDIRVPTDILQDQESSDPSKVVIEVGFSVDLYINPKEKEENHRGANTPKHFQLAIQVKKEWTLSWLDQFVILSRRTFKIRCKDYFDKLRLVQALGIALLLGLLWWKSSTNTEAQLRDQVIAMLLLFSRYKIDLLITIFIAGSRRTIRSCNHQCSKSRNGSFFDTTVIPSHRRLLCPAHTKVHEVVEVLVLHVLWFRLLLKVQYSGDQLYDCESKGGCRTLQSSLTFGIVNLKGGKKQVWILLAMALVFRLLAYLCLRRRIDHSN